MFQHPNTQRSRCFTIYWQGLPGNLCATPSWKWSDTIKNKLDQKESVIACTLLWLRAEGSWKTLHAAWPKSARLLVRTWMTTQFELPATVQFISVVLVSCSTEHPFLPQSVLVWTINYTVTVQLIHLVTSTKEKTGWASISLRAKQAPREAPVRWWRDYRAGCRPTSGRNDFSPFLKH